MQRAFPSRRRAVSRSQLFPEFANGGTLRVCGASRTASVSRSLLRRCTNIFCRAPRATANSRLEQMRQHVTIAPLADRDGIAGVVVTIEDVTDRFDRENAVSRRISTAATRPRRLRAAEKPRRRRSLRDASRQLVDRRQLARAARCGGRIGDSGGRDVIDTLIERCEITTAIPGLHSTPRSQR